MGVPLSCPFADLDDLDRRFEALLARSMSLDGSNMATTLRSFSFNGRGSERANLKSFSSGNVLFKGSVSFKGRELGTMISFRAPSNMGENVFVRSASHTINKSGEQLPTDSMFEKTPKTPLLEEESGNQRSQAAIKLQKVYKSFRTRRQLADCAVLVEQRWWKLLDFAELKHSSISFFEIEKPQTAISRWSRARTRAAKLGRVYQKTKELENLLYSIGSRQLIHDIAMVTIFSSIMSSGSTARVHNPSFIGSTLEMVKKSILRNAPDQSFNNNASNILVRTERKAYEIAVEDGKFFYKETQKLVDTREGPQNTKWIFVLSASKTLYIGQKHKGTFQHSSFLAGGATLSAGRLEVEDGILKAVWPHSGHYRPTEENFEELMSFLEEHSVDLSIVQTSPTDEEEEAHGKKRSGIAIQNSLTELDLTKVIEEIIAKSSAQEKTDSRAQDCNIAGNTRIPLPRFSRKLHSKITTLEIPRKDNVIKMFKKDGQEQQLGPSGSIPTPTDGYETAEEVLSDDDDFMIPKRNLFDEDEEEDYEDSVPKEKIIQRINSHKGTESCQLAQRLSCKWTTGAGPRIGCVRDYPTELQNRALEEVHLSPRCAFSSPRRSFRPSPRVLTPTNLCRETSAARSPLAFDQVILHKISTP
ncbi:unnamed protein product [Camellia sinensis]